MGAWDTILKYGGKAMKGMGKAANATGKSAGHAVLHPSQTLRGAGRRSKRLPPELPSVMWVGKN